MSLDKCGGEKVTSTIVKLCPLINVGEKVTSTIVKLCPLINVGEKVTSTIVKHVRYMYIYNRQNYQKYSIFRQY